MNLIQKYARIRFHANRTRTARFHRNRHLDQAINIAILDVINDRYDAIKLNGSGRKRNYNFESVMRVRNELSSIVNIETLLVLANSLEANKPADFMYSLGMKVIINGKKVNCEPMDFTEDGPHLTNNLTRPNSTIPKYLESENFKVLYGGGLSVLSAVYLTYIRKPAIVSSTGTYTSSSTLTLNAEYGVESGTVTYDGVNYGPDDFFIPTGATAFTGSGTAFLMNNTDLDDHLHEEICRRAAVILLGSVENLERMNVKKVENEEA